MRWTSALLLLCLIACSAPTAHGHAELLAGQDKDNYYPWEKLLSAQEMLIAQRDEPSPMWLHAFQALDSLSPTIRHSHIVLFNITTPILPALTALYQPATQLLVTPYDITFSSPHRTLRQLSIDQLRLASPHRFHHTAMFLPSTSHTADRRTEDRASMRLLERTLVASAAVLVMQLWDREQVEWWGDLMLPTGWVVERSWGWDRVVSGRGKSGWKLSEQWRGTGDVMTVWLLRVRADVDTVEWTEEAEAEHHGVSDSRSAWQRAVDDTADPARRNISWMPYRRINRL